MGRDSFSLTVEFPTRMFNKELGFKMIEALGTYQQINEELLDNLFTHDDKTGIVEFEEYEAYEDDKVMNILTQADIPFRAYRGRTWEMAPMTYTYRPTYEPVDGGKIISVEQSQEADDMVLSNTLQLLLDEEEKRMKKVNDTPSALYLELRAIVRKCTTDPDNIVEKYAYETEAGRNKPLMEQIDAVIKEMDAGNITNAEAMKQIAELKEKVKDNE